MSKVINCTECNKYLGEIRDAKLRKSISFLCDGCETGRKAMKMKMNTDNMSGFGNDSPFNDVFGDIFGGKQYKK